MQPEDIDPEKFTFQQLLAMAENEAKHFHILGDPSPEAQKQIAIDLAKARQGQQ